MGDPAEIEDNENLDAEAKAKAEEEARLAAEAEAEAAAKAKEEAEAKLREQLEAEGKTEEEIAAAIAEQSQETEEFEVVREGTQPQTTFDQQQVNDIVSKRVKKLNSKVKEVSEENANTNAELEIERERNKLLQLALEQAKGNSQEPEKPLTPPNPTDFDDGVNDPGYIEAHAKYTQALIDKGVSEGIAKVTQSMTEDTSQKQKSEALLSKQVKHYEKADKMGAKDYSETEDVALEIFGNDYANQIIDNFDDSHVILYYLGKNPEEAKRIKKLIETSPVKGVAEVGRLSAELKLKPKKVDIASPDEEVKGDGGGDDTDRIQKQLDKLRDQAAKTGNMKPLMEFKKKHRL